MKCFAAPEQITPPKSSRAAEGAYKNQLAEHLRGLGFTGPLTGEIVRFPFADSYAFYMVADAPQTMSLVHCPLGDAWDLPGYQTRGLRKTDILAAINRERALRQRQTTSISGDN